MKYKFLENIWLRLMAIFMGLFLWFHVATDKEYSHQMNLPIKEISLKENLSLNSELPESLQVVVFATGKQLLRKKWRERGLRINATQFIAGKHNLNLTTGNTSLIGIGNRVTLSEIIFPTSLLIDIDQKEEKYIPIRAEIIATADEGYAVSKIFEPDPAKIFVSGTRRIVQGISYLKTEQKILNGLRNNMTLTLAVVKPEASELILSPDSVTVIVEVVPVKTKVFQKLQIMIVNIPPNFSVTTEPSNVTLELVGPPGEIDLLNKNSVAISIDYNNISELNYARVKVDFPSKFKIKTISPDSVLVVSETK